MAVTTVRSKQQLTITGDVSFGSAYKITNLLDPTAAQDAATKSYVDATRSGLDVKQSVRLASTANVTVTYAATGGTSSRGQITAAPNTLDGVSLAANDRILLKDQTTGAQNGIWVVSTLGTGANGVWDRATDFDADAEVTAGAFVFVEEGTTNADSGWVLTTNNPVVIGGASGTTLTWAQFSGAGQITANNGLTKSGNTISLAAIAANSVLANNTGSSAVPSAVSMVTTATASAVPIRDTNANIRFNNSIQNLATTATAAGTTTLTAASAYTQQFTGTTTQTVVLPDATTLSVGHAFLITNRSTGIVTVNANGGGLVQTMAAASQVIVTLVTNGTAAGTWDAAYSITNAGSGGGTVTSVSVTTANGVSGTVATSTTTPAITLTLGAITPTSVNGLTFTALATGFSIAGGTTSKTLTVSNTLTLAGTDGSTLNVGGGGTLGSAAFTASTAYEPAITTLAISKGGTGTGTAPTAFGVIYAASATAYASTTANSVNGVYFLRQNVTASTAVAPDWIGSTGSGSVVLATSPSIAGGTHTALTSLGIRDTSAAFDVTIAAVSSTALTAGRTLTIDMINAARSLKLAGNIDIGGNLTTGGTFTTVGAFSTAGAFSTTGAFSVALAATAATSLTLPTSGTLVSTTNYIVRETPTGTINGSNAAFTLANTPVSGTEQVYVNGVLQNAGAGNDYTISTNTITFQSGAIPQTGDVILVTYLK